LSQIGVLHAAQRTKVISFGWFAHLGASDTVIGRQHSLHGKNDCSYYTGITRIGKISRIGIEPVPCISPVFLAVEKAAQLKKV